MKRLMRFGGIAVLACTPAMAGEIHPDLQAEIQSTPPGQAISTLVFLHEQVDAAAMTDQFDAQRARLAVRHETMVRELQRVARATQAPLVAHLAALQDQGRVSDYQAFWIANAIRVDATADEIVALAARDDVATVYFNYPIELIDPVEEGPIVNNGGVLDTPEPGVQAVRAPEVWAMGFTGEGVLVTTLDTGVDGSHPSLADRWRGVADPRYAGHPEWAFFDPYTGWTFPADSGTHGTHTMGSVCGGAPGDEVGVAPGAQWIHAAVIDRAGISQTVQDAILAYQWMIDPDGDPSTHWDVPDVCSNSWGLLTSHGYDPCDETFWGYLDNCEAAGIVMLFSAGNEGPSSNSLRRPADRATDDYRTCAVASVNANFSSWPISSYSSRGPTYCTPTGDPATKPDIAAPGEDVRSAAPGGGYSIKSGTSMASPHVNGVVALMRQANPDLTPEQIKDIIYQTAYDLGSVGEDDSYGWGMIDAYEAVNLALSTVALSFFYPDGRPELIDPAGGASIRVEVSGQSVAPVPGTGILYYSTGGPYDQVPMVEVSPNVYDAVFPALDCGATVSYYVSVEADTGETVYNPMSAPNNTYAGLAYTGLQVDLYDNFETNNGWTAENLGATSGDWQRGVPVNDPGWSYDPASDSDGSGQCWLTQNEVGNTDVDDGAVRLISSIFDMSDGGTLGYDYYLYLTNTTGAVDKLLVEASNDGGVSGWTVIADHTSSGGLSWRHHDITEDELVAAGVPPTATMRLRFTANDSDPQSINESGVDAFTIWHYYCDTGSVPGDVNGDGVVDVLDLLMVLGAWGPCAGCPEDINNDGVVNVLDLLELLANWT